MLKIIVAAVVAVSFASLDVADAASKKKKQKARAHRANQPYVCCARCHAHAGACLGRAERLLHR